MVTVLIEWRRGLIAILVASEVASESISQSELNLNLKLGRHT